MPLVRLEPRAVTAKAVLAAVAGDVVGHQWVLDLLPHIARRFRVEL